MYNYATIGDHVLIGGLYGHDFEVINNKIGVLLNIYSLIADNRIKYLAKIKIEEYEFPIDMRYVYKISNHFIDPILLSNNIVNELYQYHDVKSSIIGIDETSGNRVVICDNSLNSKTLLTISTLN